MTKYFYFIYGLSLLLILCFYFYGLSLNINNLELKSRIHIEIQELTALRNELLSKNDELVEQATQKMLHNEELKSALIELIKKSSENVYPKFTIILGVIILIGLIYYLNSSVAPATTSVVVSTSTTAYNSLIQSQAETNQVILNLQSLVNNNEAQIRCLIDQLGTNAETISNLNLKIQELAFSFSSLEQITTLAGDLLRMSNNLPGFS